MFQNIKHVEAQTAIWKLEPRIIPQKYDRRILANNHVLNC